MLNSQNDRLEYARYFLENGANPNLQAKNGSTALMLAADNPQIVTALLLAKADRNIRDNKGRTAAFYAIEKCQLNKLRLLISAPSDLKIKDEDGLTPMAYAKSIAATKKCPQIMEYLRLE